MHLGRSYRRAIGLGICAAAIAVAATGPFGDARRPMLGLVVYDGQEQAHDDAEPPDGGSLAATVSWPRAVAGLEASDICVVVYDAAGGVARAVSDLVSPIPGQPVAVRWTVAGLAAGRYTLYVDQCPSAAGETARSVEPQYLGGAADAEAASWVEVGDGAHVDVGTIALHATGLETWPRRS